LTKSTTVRIFRPWAKANTPRSDSRCRAGAGQRDGLRVVDDRLARAAHRLSKSGLFAHFGSREELQVAAIEAAGARFTETVFLPALKARRGLPRLRALFERWLDWAARSGLTYGCPMQAAAVEFDDRPGPVRDVVLEHFSRLDRELHRAVELAVTERHFRHDLDVGQFVFEMMGMIFAYHHQRPDAQGGRRRVMGTRRVRAAGGRRIAGCLKLMEGTRHERLSGRFR
jgi:AcrR family transcriptional regulator